MKANLGPAGDTIAMRWQDGVFVRIDAPQTRPRDVVGRIDLDNRLVAEMGAMMEGGAEIPANPAASNGFANAVRRRSGFTSYPQQTIVDAQERLIKDGRAVIAEL